MSKFIDLSGQQFGKWTVIGRGKPQNGKFRWLCRCACGATRSIRGHSLRNGESNSCSSCCRRGILTAEDISGQKFQRLTVIRRAGIGNKGQVKWECQCECGKIVITEGHRLKSGRTVSCGCFAREVAAKNNLIHGRSIIRYGKRLDPTYSTWIDMKNRCHDPNQKAYKWYGARSIIVCERWRNDFMAFLDDMGERPRNHSIERIDNALGYEPSNCKWIPKSLQNLNKRNVKLTHRTAIRIREFIAAGMNIRGIASFYGMATSSIYNIKNGRSWVVKEVLHG